MEAIAERVPLDSDLPVLHIVEYPGYLKDERDPSGVIRTLGGISKLSACFSSRSSTASAEDAVFKSSKPLDRPLGPVSKAAVSRLHENGLEIRYEEALGEERSHVTQGVISGDIVSTCNLILCVRRLANGERQIRIAGVVLKTGRFRSMADYQYRLPKDDPAVELQKILAKADWTAVDAFDTAAADAQLNGALQKFAGFGGSVGCDTNDAKTFGVPPAVFSFTHVPQSYGFKQVELSRELKAGQQANKPVSKPTAGTPVTDSQILNDISVSLEQHPPEINPNLDLNSYIDQLMKVMPIPDTSNSANPSNSDDNEDSYQIFNDMDDESD